VKGVALALYSVTFVTKGDFANFFAQRQRLISSAF